jgi:hypothetical protein
MSSPGSTVSARCGHPICRDDIPRSAVGIGLCGIEAEKNDLGLGLHDIFLIDEIFYSMVIEFSFEKKIGVELCYDSPRYLPWMWPEEGAEL